MLRARAGVELRIFLRQLFLSGDFQPDGFCYRWNSGLVWLNVCGMTHVMEVWNLWHAQYWLAGIIKTITALASILTAILLVQLAEKRTLASRKSRSMVADYLGGRWGMASGSRPSFLTSRRARR